jgi:UDP-galactopyranose mutase
MAPADRDRHVADLVGHHVAPWAAEPVLLWHLSVMAEPLSRDLDVALTVFDCMDELSAFRGAPPELVERERALLDRADLVFTGGYSLYEAKRHLHPSVHAFPSGVDLDHFARARTEQPEPAVLAGIPKPRLVYAGVIDERLDLALLDRVAAADIGELVLVGPVAKIDPEDVPRGARVHHLGMQPYEALPSIFAHTDVGLMPFARNEATRFISPTKTPEYLAAGLPVVTTPIHDVVRGYGDLDAVRIADDPAGFVAACEDGLRTRRHGPAVDERLRDMSWDSTWAAMQGLIDAALARVRAA